MNEGEGIVLSISFLHNRTLIKFPIAIKSQILIQLPSSSIQSNWFWTMSWLRIETPSGLTPNESNDEKNEIYGS